MHNFFITYTHALLTEINIQVLIKINLVHAYKVIMSLISFQLMIYIKACLITLQNRKKENFQRSGWAVTTSLAFSYSTSHMKDSIQGDNRQDYSLISFLRIGLFSLKLDIFFFVYIEQCNILSILSLHKSNASLQL